MKFFFLCRVLPKKKMQYKEVAYSFLIDFIFYIRVNRLMTCEQVGKKMKNTGLMLMQALCVKTRSCGDM